MRSSRRPRWACGGLQWHEPVTQRVAVSLALKRRLVFAAIMAAMMTGVVSFVVTAVNTGFTAGFVARWLKSYAVAFACAAPIIHFAAPAVRRWIERNIS